MWLFCFSSENLLVVGIKRETPVLQLNLGKLSILIERELLCVFDQSQQRGRVKSFHWLWRLANQRREAQKLKLCAAISHSAAGDGARVANGERGHEFFSGIATYFWFSLICCFVFDNIFVSRILPKMLNNPFHVCSLYLSCVVRSSFWLKFSCWRTVSREFTSFHQKTAESFRLRGTWNSQ